MGGAGSTYCPPGCCGHSFMPGCFAGTGALPVLRIPTLQGSSAAWAFMQQHQVIPAGADSIEWFVNTAPNFEKYYDEKSLYKLYTA